MTRIRLILIAVACVFPSVVLSHEIGFPDICQSLLHGDNDVVNELAQDQFSQLKSDRDEMIRRMVSSSEKLSLSDVQDVEQTLKKLDFGIKLGNNLPGWGGVSTVLSSLYCPSGRQTDCKIVSREKNGNNTELKIECPSILYGDFYHNEYKSFIDTVNVSNTGSCNYKLNSIDVGIFSKLQRVVDAVMGRMTKDIDKWKSLHKLNSGNFGSFSDFQKSN
ncbi:hypothetical protein [Photobacterium kishitanii]|uniref:Uncharacterized protein n=1 Tax=Photobacterium kishitanii TaxID=318456 RepID=A0A2T3KMJ3_9GAMM|nr:hypothetical protein [Photobacterium kishitanii]PSV01011.1 hypothetical protein C9J27_03005 [Photobacterium kishitanii]